MSLCGANRAVASRGVANVPCGASHGAVSGEVSDCGEGSDDGARASD